MIIARVIGHVWATKKEESLSGQKLMIMREETTNRRSGEIFVAADSVGAGIGEQVLVVTGSTRPVMAKTSLMRLTAVSKEGEIPFRAARKRLPKLWPARVPSVKR